MSYICPDLRKQNFSKHLKVVVSHAAVESQVDSEFIQVLTETDFEYSRNLA